MPKYEAHRKLNENERNILANLLDGGLYSEIEEAEFTFADAHAEFLKAKEIHDPVSKEFALLLHNRADLQPEEFTAKYNALTTRLNEVSALLEENGKARDEARRPLDSLKCNHEWLMAERAAVVFYRMGFLKGSLHMAEDITLAGDAADSAKMMRNLLVATNNPKYADNLIAELLQSDTNEGEEE